MRVRLIARETATRAIYGEPMPPETRSLRPREYPVAVVPCLVEHDSDTGAREILGGETE